MSPAQKYLRGLVLTNAFWRAIEEAGLIQVELNKDGKEKTTRFRFHDLRHTFGSHLGMAGKDLKTIMEIMAHKNPRTAMRYQHPSPDHKLSFAYPDVILLSDPSNSSCLVGAHLKKLKKLPI